MLSKSSGLTPTRLPVGKFRSGADVSIPSTSCTNLVFASVEKPLVFIAAKFKLPEGITTEGTNLYLASAKKKNQLK